MESCRVFSSGGEGGGDLPLPLTAVFPPLQIGSNSSGLYFPKDNTPPRPPYHPTGSHANIPPLQNIPRKYPAFTSPKLCKTFWVG